MLRGVECTLSRGVDGAESMSRGDDVSESTSISRSVSAGESSEVGVKGEPIDEGVRVWGE